MSPSTRGGVPGWRHVSVQRILLGPPTRIAAVCHRANTLRWFRLDYVTYAAPDSNETFRQEKQADVDALVAESLGGFHDGHEPVPCVFVVREPEARWVERNLPGAMDVERIDVGIRVSTKTAGVQPLARFVVGLGDAARAETPELALMVTDLARGAASVADAIQRPKALTGVRSGGVNVSAVRSKRASR